MNFRITSFENGALIPAEFAFCQISKDKHTKMAPNRNPHIIWDDLPPGTESLVLICVDPDVPSIPDNVNQEDRTISKDFPRIDFFHWVLINIDPGIKEIPAGAVSDGITPKGKPWGKGAFGFNGLNSYTDWFAYDDDMVGNYRGYDGPCPPWNDEIIHHYHFTLYALNIKELDLHGLFNGWEVRDAIKKHILNQADWVGTYTLNPDLI